MSIPPICQYGPYQCRYGYECTYYHPEMIRPLCQNCGSNFAVPVVPFTCTPCQMEFRKHICKYFQKDGCRLGDMCSRQHGDDDEREICLDCQTGRVRTDHKYCWYCYNSRKNDYKNYKCIPFEETQVCEYGDHCINMHGIDDTREICNECNENRMSEGCNTCDCCETVDIHDTEAFPEL